MELFKLGVQIDPTAAEQGGRRVETAARAMERQMLAARRATEGLGPANRSAADSMSRTASQMSMLDRAARNLQTSLGGAASMLTRLWQGLVALPGALAASNILLAPFRQGWELVGKAIDKAAASETNYVRLAVMRRSFTVAKQEMASLKQLADRTPFSTSQLLDTLIGIDPIVKDLGSMEKALMLVGDAASGAQAPIDSVGLWLTRLQQGLKVGLPVGEAIMSLREMKVLSAEASVALQMLSEDNKGGRNFAKGWSLAEAELRKFSGSMELQSATWTGKVNTMEDTWSGFLSTLGKPIAESFKPLIDSRTEFFAKLNQGAKQFEPQVRRAATYAAALVAVISNPANWQTSLQAMAEGLRRLLGFLSRAALEAAERIGVLIAQAIGSNEVQDAIGTAIVKGGGRAIQFLKERLADMWQTTLGKGIIIGAGIRYAAPVISAPLAAAAPAIGGAAAALGVGAGGKAMAAAFANPVIAASLAAIVIALIKIDGLAKGIGDAWNGMMAAWEEFKRSAVFDYMMDSFEMLKEAAQNFVDSLNDALSSMGMTWQDVADNIKLVAGALAALLVLSQSTNLRAMAVSINVIAGAIRVVGVVLGGVHDAGRALGKFFRELFDYVARKIQQIIAAIKDLGSAIAAIPGKIGDALTPNAPLSADEFQQRVQESRAQIMREREAREAGSAPGPINSGMIFSMFGTIEATAKATKASIDREVVEPLKQDLKSISDNAGLEDLPRVINGGLFGIGGKPDSYAEAFLGGAVEKQKTNEALTATESIIDKVVEKADELAGLKSPLSDKFFEENPYTPPEVDLTDRDADKQIDDLKRLREQYVNTYGTAREQLGMLLDEIASWHEKGAITEEEMLTAQAAAVDEFRKRQRDQALSAKQDAERGNSEFEKLMGEWGNLIEQFDQAAIGIASSFASNFSDAFSAVASGTKTVSEAFGDMALNVISDITRIITQLVIQYTLQQLIGGLSGGGGNFGAFLQAGLGGTTATVAHDGSMETRRIVPYAIFASARRYHEGGAVKPDEVPAILTPDEMVLTRRQQADIRERLSSGGTQEASGGGVTIINLQDPREIDTHLAANPQSLINVMGRNAPAIRRVLGIKKSA